MNQTWVFEFHQVFSSLNIYWIILFNDNFFRDIRSLFYRKKIIVRRLLFHSKLFQLFEKCSWTTKWSSNFLLYQSMSCRYEMHMECVKPIKHWFMNLWKTGVSFYSPKETLSKESLWWCEVGYMWRVLVQKVLMICIRHYKFLK